MFRRHSKQHARWTGVHITEQLRVDRLSGRFTWTRSRQNEDTRGLPWHHGHLCMGKCSYCTIPAMLHTYWQSYRDHLGPLMWIELMIYYGVLLGLHVCDTCVRIRSGVSYALHGLLEPFPTPKFELPLLMACQGFLRMDSQLLSQSSCLMCNGTLLVQSPIEKAFLYFLALYFRSPSFLLYSGTRNHSETKSQRKELTPVLGTAMYCARPRSFKAAPT